MSNGKGSTALVTRGSIAGLPTLVTPIRQIPQLRERIEAMQSVAIILCPFTSLDSIPYGYRVSERVFVPNLEINQGDVYQDRKFCGAEEVALAKNGILGAWLASGGSVLWSRRMDDRTIRDYVEWSVMLKLRQIDGNETTYPGEKTIDLRDGSAQAQGLTAGDLLNRRRHIVTMAETKAIERACRGVLKLKQKYELKELREKPFVAYALVEDDEQLDPETRRIVTLHRRGLITQLYGPESSGPAALPGASGRELPAIASTIEVAATTAADPSDSPDDFGAPPDAEGKPLILCGCNCGDQNEITEQIAALTIERVGSQRCGRCFPWGPKFDQAAHRDLKSLGLPKFPAMDGPAAMAAHNEWMGARAKGGGK